MSWNNRTFLCLGFGDLGWKLWAPILRHYGPSHWVPFFGKGFFFWAGCQVVGMLDKWLLKVNSVAHQNVFWQRMSSELMDLLPNELSVHTCLISSNFLKNYRYVVWGQSGGLMERIHLLVPAPPLIPAAWPRMRPFPIPNLILLFYKLKQLNLANSVSDTTFSLPSTWK